MYNIAAYLPDSLLPQYEAVRDGLVSALETLGLIKSTQKGDAGTFPLSL